MKVHFTTALVVLTFCLPVSLSAQTTPKVFHPFSEDDFKATGYMDAYWSAPAPTVTYGGGDLPLLNLPDHPTRHCQMNMKEQYRAGLENNPWMKIQKAVEELAISEN